MTPCITNVNDLACCSPSTEDDCVYNGLCYTDDDNANTFNVISGWTNNNMSCSSKHWCPVGFEFNPVTDTCEPVETPCYAGPGYPCITTSYPYFNLNDPYNCLAGGPGSHYNPGPNPYEDACCYWQSWGFDYYHLVSVYVYGNPSGSGFGSGE